MAIVKKISPLGEAPIGFVDPVINQLAALLTDCNHGVRVSGGYVKKGSLWNIGGTMFMADSDTAITGTRSAATTGVMFTVSGDTATVSYGTGALTWNGSYQGFYDTSGNFYYVGDVITGNLIVSTTSGHIKNESYTKICEYQVRHGGIYSILITMTEGVGGSPYYAKIYINDNPVGTEFIPTTTNSMTENLFIEDRDKISVYAKRSSVDSTWMLVSLCIMNGEEGQVT